MTEERAYSLVKKIGPIEIRDYEPCVLADVVVNSEYRNAGNIGFRPLVSYISQNQIAMTAPVIQEEQATGAWKVSFVMPAEKTMADLPIPKNSKVSLRESPRHYAAALRFSGFTRGHRVQSKEQVLRDALETEGIRAIGPVQIARFDPPWTPSILRHNEVILEIEYPPPTQR